MSAPLHPSDPAVDTSLAPEMDVPISYLPRIRAYYEALGYDTPYHWAHYAEVPFAPLRKPLKESNVTLITTAAPYQPDKGPQGPDSPYNAAAKFYTVYSGNTAASHDLRISHVAIDRRHADMSDANCWFPLPALQRAARHGRIRLAPRFHGAPTNRSQRHTLQTDAPEILRRCREDAVDAAILVANCPVCHQSLSLIARVLEAAGISTVILGCAKDIVEHVGVARFLFSDFPLGNAAARPADTASQDSTLELALRLLEGAPAPRTSVQSPLVWLPSHRWKADYDNIDRLSPHEIEALRQQHDASRATAGEIRNAACCCIIPADEETSHRQKSAQE